jgi:predicted transcriptional regulator
MAKMNFQEAVENERIEVAMHSKSRRSDDFGTFLQSIQRAVKPDQTKDTSITKIMNTLSKLGKVDVVQLMTVVEMSWTDFSSGIQSLQSAGLVTVEETPGGKVQLTDDGKHWANALISRADDETI